MLVYIKPLSIFPKLHSDTIFGAIISVISELYPEKVEEIISKFRENPPFLVSSPFPFVFNDNEKIRFFPKIITNVKNSTEKTLDDDKLSNQKKFKKVKYIQEEIFLKLLEGNLKESDIVNNLDSYNIKEDIIFKSDISIDGRYKDTVIPNNTINRITQEAEPFYSEGYEYDKMGLFFLVDFKDNEYKAIFEGAIRFLKDRGFGKDVSTGKGHFNFEIDENYNLPNIDGKSFTTLSRFIPNDNDLINIDKSSAYEIGSKRGKSKEGELRKQVKFFKEGSTFTSFNEFYGKIVDSGNTYPAIEYGYAFPINFKNGEE